MLQNTDVWNPYSVCGKKEENTTIPLNAPVELASEKKHPPHVSKFSSETKEHVA